MTAYYNECDPFAAAWLRELMKANLIASGDVDERDICDVTPNDIATYDQCHFFAGIGTWSYALRQAGWPDNRSAWTGSCPCQPFSAAGSRVGFDDERHLWPSWFWLISQSRPGVIFGEQVSSRDGLAWLDLVQTDLEASGYAVGPLDLCAAGVGAPHKRQRLFFVADAECDRRYNRGGASKKRIKGREEHPASERGALLTEIERLRTPCDMADTKRRTTERHGYQVGGTPGQTQSQTHQRKRLRNDIRNGVTTRSMAHTKHDGGRTDEQGRQPERRVADGWSGPTNGFWRDADWLPCRDGKFRAIEPGTFPLAHGATARMGRLRGYGNAIVAPLAIEFIKAYMKFQER